MAEEQSHAVKVLSALEAVIEGRASRVEREYEIAGRRIALLSPDELMKWYSFYKTAVNAESRSGKRQKISTRFVRE